MSNSKKNITIKTQYKTVHFEKCKQDLGGYEWICYLNHYETNLGKIGGGFFAPSYGTCYQIHSLRELTRDVTAFMRQLRKTR